MTEANTVLHPTTMPSVISAFTNSTPVLSTGKSASLGIAILSLAFIIGFPGNAFVIWTILTRMKKRTVTCLLILHLAIADVLVILTAPFFLHLLSTGSWTFGNIICKMCHYISCLSMYTSIFLITFMSMDRFLAVAKPFTSQKVRTTPIVRGIVSIIWLLASLLAITMFFYRAVIPINNRPQCIPIHKGPNHMVFQYIFETLTGFVIPFTIIVFCYIYIGIRLRTAKFQTKQTSRLVIMIIVTFALFWLPYQVVNMLQVSGQLFSPSLTKAAISARPNTIALAFLSSSANPILYVFAGGNFIKSAGVGFMAKLFEGTASETSSFRKISQVFRQRSHTESVELEKCLEQAEQSKTMLSNQTDGL
ncbi:LOW QUALITY PROTEIN: leukotriene B4 receptor 1-like [Bufo gargarizans]|uniref:LOW QUALITY PROTEIN: leukotriene B4 receptor 1-like n=1 Tax=Bufo gargarizans TaxID=30331 RepID=UPI001CF4259C|nr:LOW QUALITY PROTEIN: leukotriene B4 receptor 1-like [Bufo gargarizans]